MTREEQIKVITDVARVAIEQSAEESGLLGWLVWRCLNELSPEEDLNEDAIAGACDLTEPFESIIDPDDAEYFQSKIYKDREKSNE